MAVFNFSPKSPESSAVTKEELISRLTCESIALAALNIRCNGARYKGGPILDGLLAREKQNKMAYIDGLLDNLLIFLNGGEPVLDLEPPTEELELPEGRGTE